MTTEEEKLKHYLRRKRNAMTKRYMAKPEKNYSQKVIQKKIYEPKDITLSDVRSGRYEYDRTDGDVSDE